MPVTSVTPKSARYGKFATTSRLVACLIVEDLVDAYFCPCEVNGQDNGCIVIGLCVMLRAGTPVTFQDIQCLDDIFAIIPLRGLPEIDVSSTVVLNGTRCSKIELLDPWDMHAHVYAPGRARTLQVDDLSGAAVMHSKMIKAIRMLGFKDHKTGLYDGCDANQLWCQFSRDYGVNEKISKLIASELDSAMLHQTYTYDHPKVLPTLQSSSLEWEQSLVEGHPTHPMHKTRTNIPPLPPLYPDQIDFERPKIRLVAIPADFIQLRGDFEADIAPLVDAILNKTGTAKDQRSKYVGYVLMPVHEIQVPNVEIQFKNAVVLPEVNHVIGVSLASLRTIAFPGILDNLTVKISMGIKVTSALRTITPNTTYFGPGFSHHVVPHLSYDRQILIMERELASASYRHPDADIAKHCSCILREISVPNPDEIHIITAALMEKIQRPDTEETMVTHALNLDTEEKREKFLERYVQLALQAFVPPCRDNGVAFEAHAQNVLARIDKRTGELCGFVVRDFGGLRIHNETLKRTCGVELDILPNSPVSAKSMDNVYNCLYHTLFSNHLQRMIRVLGMHHNGRGWQMVRKYFAELVAPDHPMYHYFMKQDKILGKCFVLMKIEDLYCDHIYRPKPNLFFTGLSKPLSY